MDAIIVLVLPEMSLVVLKSVKKPVITKVKPIIKDNLSLVLMDVILVLVPLLDKSIVLKTHANLPPVLTKAKPIMKETLSIVKMDAILVLALPEMSPVVLKSVNLPPVITKVVLTTKETLSLV